MEKLYRKKENGRYEEYSYGYNGELSDGIWLVQTKPNVKSVSSLFWKVGDIKRPCDVTTHAAIQALGDDLTKYVMKLKDENSDAFKEAKKEFGGYILGGLRISNFSASDLIQLILKQISLKIEEDEKRT